MTEEHKRKIGEANKISHKGKILSEQHKKSISDALTGVKRKPFTRTPHSQETKQKMRLAATARYDRAGRRSPVAKALRTCAPYKEWRTAVFERDDYTCQSCGVRGGEMNADHIVQFAKLVYALISKHGYEKAYKAGLKDKTLWDINNGRTLCVPCHSMTDTYCVNVKSVV